MKREKFKATIKSSTFPLKNDESAVRLSITTDGRNINTLPSLTEDELMEIHNEIENYFLNKK